MILLYFVDNLSNSGGIQRMLVNKINYLADNPLYTIHIVCFQKCDSFFKINPNISLHNLGIESMDSFFAKVSNLISLIRKTKHLLDVIQPDVVINENMRTISFVLPFIKKTIPKINVIHFSHTGQVIMDTLLYKNRLHRFLIRSLRLFIFRKYERFIVLTEFDQLKWALPNVQIIPNFTNVEPTVTPSLLSRKVVFIGRFEHQKDVLILINAWSIVSKSAPDWTLELYGSGSEEDIIRSRIEGLGLEDSVILKGLTSDMHQVYQNASLLVNSSIYEGFVLVVLEALTVGIPCISFDIPGCNNMIQDNVNGFLVKERTSDDLARKILYYINLPYEHKKNIQNRIPDTIAKYSRQCVMKQWMDLFDELIQKNIKK